MSDIERIMQLPAGAELDRQVARIMQTGIYFSPSTSMWDAWKVAERFKLTITPKTDATERSRWLADTELKSEDKLWAGYGPTVQMAICRAAIWAASQGQYREKALQA